MSEEGGTVPEYVIDIKFVLEGVLTPIIGVIGIFGKIKKICLQCNLIKIRDAPSKKSICRELWHSNCHRTAEAGAEVFISESCCSDMCV